MDEDAAAPVKPVSRWDVPVEDSTEEDGWLLVYLDVMTLLVVMFVVMLAFAGEGKGDTETVDTPVETPSPQPEPDGLPEQWEPGALGEDIDIAVEGESVRFRISSEILFESGEAELSMRGLDALDRIIPALEGSDHEIRVAGHTDDVPIQTQQFPSNWELSSARAGQVVRYLESQGIPSDRMIALGYAHTEPRSSNDTPEGRARNRRVELTLNPSERAGDSAPANNQ